MKKYDNTGVFLVRNKKTKNPIRFSFKWDDGTTTRIAFDPNEEWCTFYESSLREEHALENKEARYRLIYDKKDREVIDIEDCADTYDLSEEINKQEHLAKQEVFLASFLATLTPTQKRRLLMRANDLTLTYSDIARKEKVDESSIRECFISIQKKFNKFLSKKHPRKVGVKCGSLCK